MSYDDYLFASIKYLNMPLCLKSLICYPKQLSVFSFVFNAILESKKYTFYMESLKTPKRIKDKSDRATQDTVLDNRTRNILNKLTIRNVLTDLTGCISRGKEANVYTALVNTNGLNCKLVNNYPENAKKLENNVENEEHVDTTNFVPCAIKIYSTSIMQFKDRLKYIQSERRFETFCNTNPRKLVKLWAEKEVRNIKRLNKHNIPAPYPIYLKNNVLIMTLIENNGNIAQRLKDTVVDDYNDFYSQSLTLLDDMYNKCGLIHSDYSEYNILVSQNKLVVIDMGQAVEKSHDNADEFLIKDIINNNNFFKKKCGILSVNSIFERITGKVIPVCLKEMDITSYVTIPDNIVDVANEEDYGQYIANTRTCKPLQEAEKMDIEEEDENEEMICVKMTKEEERAQRKLDRRNVKEEKREKRKQKMPKKEKKKREKLYKKRK